jgi:hypothetical protein
MKKLILAYIVLFTLFASCADRNLPAVNGMWQLKTVQDGNNIQTIDTVFYGFQRQTIFSFTLLKENDNKPATAIYIYGYADYPDDKVIHIIIDENEKNKLSVKENIPNLPWNWKKTEMAFEVTYHVEKLNSKQMILSSDGKTYNFIKY